MAVSVATRHKRRRLPTKRLYSEGLVDRNEEKMLKIALANSKTETERCEVQVPQAQTYYPTLEEFLSPTKYIEKIKPEACKTGICKIVPPKGWNPPVAVDLNDDSIRFPTRLQRLHQLQQGKYYDEGKKHTFQSYRAQGDEFRRKWFEKKGLKDDTTSDEIAKEYWRLVETGQEEVEVLYANDLDTTKTGSGFPLASPQDLKLEDYEEDRDVFGSEEYYRNCGWNLNNLPKQKGSLLRHIDTAINGVNVPWLYCGMLFATFCWHTEDNYLYSLNYMHYGAKKRWYGVPESCAVLFEKIMHNNVPLRFREDPSLLFHLVTMISPTTLLRNRAQVYTIVQEPGDIIITFPQSYHAGFSEGFNCNEAVNFALPDWIPFGRSCLEKYRKYGRLSVFSHDRLMAILAANLDCFNERCCLMLLYELRRVYDEEVYYRKAIVTVEHVTNVVQMAPNDPRFNNKSMMHDDDRQCAICKHSCYFSGVVCSCSETAVSCLRHAFQMCNCPRSQKLLLVWMSMKEMKQLIDKVQNRVKILQRAIDEKNPKM